VVEELVQILSDRTDVAIRRAFTRKPEQAELDRHLQLRSPQAILVSTDGNNYALDLVEYLRRTYPNLPLVILHSVANHGAASLLPFMRAGVREVIFQPLDRNEVDAAIDRVCAMPVDDAIPKLGKLLCFLPSKPGVGASTVAINTAAALARGGSKVLLVDGDLTSGMVRFMLKLQNPASIRDAAQRVSELDELLWPQLITQVREGLDVLHAGIASPACGLDSGVLLSLMDFWRAAYDFVCFDFSGNMEQFSLDAMRFADRIFLVSTSEITSLHLLNEKAAILKANDVIDRVQVVLNRKTRNENLTKQNIEDLIGLPVCKVIRNSYSETLAANTEGRTVRANSALGGEFKAFAAELCGKPLRNEKSFSVILAAFGKKRRGYNTRQATGAVRVVPRAAVTFQPMLALPEAAPKALVPYMSSTRVEKM
jgi:pilus assembly protein CpaE